MLLKQKIRPDCKMHTDDWMRNRLSKFTASRIHELMGKKGLGEIGMNYIRTRVSEHLTQKSSEKYITTESAERGLALEPDAIREFIKRHEIDPRFAYTQVMLQDMEEVDGILTDNRFSATPDIIWILNENQAGMAWNVIVGEVKCYEQLHFMQVVKIENPLQLKEEDPQLYWQLLFQMEVAETLEGYAVFFNPDFMVGAYKEVHVRVIWKHTDDKGKESYPVKDDLNLLKLRKKEAMKEFNELREYMFTL